MFDSSKEKLDEIVEAILDIGEFEVLVKTDSFNRKGDILEFYDQEAHGRDYDPYNVYLRGKSTNPEVDDDIWSVDWIITNIENKRLTSHNPSEDQKLVDSYEELNNIISDEESEPDA